MGFKYDATSVQVTCVLEFYSLNDYEKPLENKASSLHQGFNY